MKKFYTLALSLFAAAFLFTGCDDLTTIDFSFSIPTEHSFNVIGTTQAVSASQTVDLTENDEFSKNKDKIKNVEIESVEYRITSFQGAPTAVLNGQIEVAESSTAPRTLLYTIAGWNIQDQYNTTANDNWLTIPLNEDGKSKLTDLIKNDPHTASLVLTGSTSEVPVNFTILFKINWKMTASQDVI